MHKMDFRFIFLFIFFILFLNFVNAGTLLMDVQTLENYTLNLNFLNPERGLNPSYGSKTNNTGGGYIDLVFSNDALVYDLDLFLMKEGITIIHKTFEEIKNDQRILLFLVPGASSITEGYTGIEKIDITNESTEQNNSSLNETSNSSNAGLDNSTNPVISQGTADIINNHEDLGEANNSGIWSNLPDFFSQRIFYGGIVIIVLLFLIIIFSFALKRIKNRENRDEIFSKTDNEKHSSVDDLEKKLKEALEELEDLKKEKEKDSEIRDDLKDDIEEKKKIIKQIKTTKEKLTKDKEDLIELRDNLRDKVKRTNKDDKKD